VEKAHQEIQAEIDRITFRNEDNGWSVLQAKMTSNLAPVTITGHFLEVREGDHFDLEGEWTTHPTFGKQFLAKKSIPSRPKSPYGIKRYLSSGLIKGIGEKTADRIVQHFGERTFAVLDENPGCLLEVPKIGRKKALTIIESLREQKGSRDIMVFLSQHGVSPNLAQRIFKQYGERTIAMIEENPYRLASEIARVGFIIADKIAKSLGVQLDSEQRIKAAISYQIEILEERGHCYVSDEQVLGPLGTLLEIDSKRIQEVFENCIKSLNESGSLVSEFYDARRIHYRAEIYAAEMDVAAKIKELMSHTPQIDSSRVNDWLERFVQAANLKLSTAQVSAVKKAASSPVFVLTGGPGVGKTTTANAIIKLFKAMRKSIILAAPTGRAAQRLSELSGEPARTLHRLLEWTPGSDVGFARNEANPLMVDVVIVDESSMLDIKLAQALFTALREKVQIILIGDVDQLPSVGPGNVLRDLIDSNVVPYVKLTEIFRQAAQSNIVRFAHDINQGMTPEFPRSGGDCHFIEANSNEEVMRVIKDLVTDVLPKNGFDAKTQVQVLIPMNKGEIGTLSLNDTLQSVLNPIASFQKEEKNKLRPGDKVIQTSNNYELQIFNGDIGYVSHTNVDGKKTIVTFSHGRSVTFSPDDAMELRLAYAITIHKSQGSEFPAVILPITMQHYVMLERNLIYTGLTRARKLAIFIGSRKALQLAIQNTTSSTRQTRLSELLSS